MTLKPLSPQYFKKDQDEKSRLGVTVFFKPLIKDKSLNLYNLKNIVADSTLNNLQMAVFVKIRFNPFPNDKFLTRPN